MTRDQIEKQVADDFAALPKYIRTTYLKGYQENGDTREFTFDEPGLLVRVDEATSDELTRWMDDWLDPFWPVTPIETVPEMEGVHGFEMYGTSYRFPSGESDATAYTPVSRIAGELARIKAAIS